MSTAESIQQGDMEDRYASPDAGLREALDRLHESWCGTPPVCGLPPTECYEDATYTLSQIATALAAHPAPTEPFDTHAHMGD